MTAKHRKGKGNIKHEDNTFKNEAQEPDVRGRNHKSVLLIVSLIIVIGGITVAWFFIQHYQTTTYLADNLVEMQMKMVKLQSFQEEIRKTNEKQLSSEGFEHRLHALEESHALAQKQVGMVLATAEQLTTSDLPAQVLSLQTEMKARLAEMQQNAVSIEQLDKVQGMLKGQGEKFEPIPLQVKGLDGVSRVLVQGVESLSGRMATMESRLEERAELVEHLSLKLEEQALQLLGLKDLLTTQKTQLEITSLEITSVKKALEMDELQESRQVSVENQLNSVRQSLQEQTKTAQSLHSELKAEIHAIQSQLESDSQLEMPSAAEVPPDIEAIVEKEAQLDLEAAMDKEAQIDIESPVDTEDPVAIEASLDIDAPVEAEAPVDVEAQVDSDTSPPVAEEEEEKDKEEEVDEADGFPVEQEVTEERAAQAEEEAFGQNQEPADMAAPLPEEVSKEETGPLETEELGERITAQGEDQIKEEDDFTTEEE